MGYFRPIAFHDCREILDRRVHKRRNQLKTKIKIVWQSSDKIFLKGKIVEGEIGGMTTSIFTIKSKVRQD